MKKVLFFILLFSAIINSSKSQNLKGGEITSQFLAGLTYQFKVSMYSLDTARNELYIHYGDGTSELLHRDLLVDLINGIRLSIYHSTHTFPAPNTYILSIQDSFRIANIENIPNSANTYLFLQEELVINPFTGPNNSAVFNTLQTSIANNGGVIIHDPGVTDTENDSLVFSLVSPIGINGYTLPPATDSLYIEPSTGILIWNKPVSIGIFNVCIKAEEWRNNINIGYVIRDMLISIDSTTGIDDVVNKTKVDIAPNPFTTSAQITLDKTYHNISLSVYDIQGKLMLQKQYADCNQIQLNRDGLNNGMYFLKLRLDERGVETGKVVVKD